MSSGALFTESAAYQSGRPNRLTKGDFCVPPSAKTRDYIERRLVLQTFFRLVPFDVMPFLYCSLHPHIIRPHFSDSTKESSRRLAGHFHNPLLVFTRHPSLPIRNPAAAPRRSSFPTTPWHSFCGSQTHRTSQASASPSCVVTPPDTRNAAPVSSTDAALRYGRFLHLLLLGVRPKLRLDHRRCVIAAHEVSRKEKEVQIELAAAHRELS